MKKLLIQYFIVLALIMNAQARPDQSLNNIKIENKGILPVDNGISFIALGDFGRHGHYTQKEVAKAMGDVVEILDLSFTLTVGDNFYPTGIQSTQDPQWASSYENIYTHHLLHEPWYVALGNHDYEGDINAQIDYTKISRRWELPSTYYEKMIRIADEKWLQLLVIDTTPMVESYKSQTEKFPQISLQDSEKQIEWLKEKLSNNNPKIAWKIVVGHHPLYSGGKRKQHKDTQQIKELLLPIFKKHKIDAYICGHEHDLQIINQDGFPQFLSGAGSELVKTGNTNGTLFAQSVPGFIAFTLTPKELKAYVIQAQTDSFQLIYKTSIKK